MNLCNYKKLLMWKLMLFWQWAIIGVSHWSSTCRNWIKCFVQKVVLRFDIIQCCVHNCMLILAGISSIIFLKGLTKMRNIYNML